MYPFAPRVVKYSYTRELPHSLRDTQIAKKFNLDHRNTSTVYILNLAEAWMTTLSRSTTLTHAVIAPKSRSPPEID